MDDLVTVEWLARCLDDPGIVVLDATYLPFEPERDAAAEYRAGHIPGARFLDLKTLADTDDPRPTMAPTLDQFRARMAALGVRRDDRIILYDDSPHRTAARARQTRPSSRIARVCSRAASTSRRRPRRARFRRSGRSPRSRPRRQTGTGLTVVPERAGQSRFGRSQRSACSTLTPRRAA